MGGEREGGEEMKRMEERWMGVLMWMLGWCLASDSS